MLDMKNSSCGDALRATLSLVYSPPYVTLSHASLPPPSPPACLSYCSFLLVNASRHVMETEAEHINLIKEDLT